MSITKEDVVMLDITTKKGIFTNRCSSS